MPPKPKLRESDPAVMLVIVFAMLLGAGIGSIIALAFCTWS